MIDDVRPLLSIYSDTHTLGPSFPTLADPSEPHGCVCCCFVIHWVFLGMDERIGQLSYRGDSAVTEEAAQEAIYGPLPLHCCRTKPRGSPLEGPRPFPPAHHEGRFNISKDNVEGSQCHSMEGPPTRPKGPVRQSAAHASHTNPTHRHPPSTVPPPLHAHRSRRDAPPLILRAHRCRPHPSLPPLLFSCPSSPLVPPTYSSPLTADVGLWFPLPMNPPTAPP